MCVFPIPSLTICNPLFLCVDLCTFYAQAGKRGRHRCQQVCTYLISISNFCHYNILNITLCDAAGFCMLKDQKNLQGQLIAEREALYRSKPSPSKPLGGKKAHGMSTLLGSRGMHQTPKLTRKQISVRSMELYQLVILSLTINRN